MFEWTGWSALERGIMVLALAAAAGVRLAGGHWADVGFVLLVGALLAFVPGRFVIEQNARRRR